MSHPRRVYPPDDFPLGVRSLKRGEPGWYPVPRTWLTLGAMGGGIIASGIGLWGYARYVEPRWIDWHTVRLPIRDLPPAFDGYKLIHLSDLHLGTGKLLTPARLKRILQRVNHYRPDLIAITGDFASSFDSTAEAGIAELSILRAKDGIYCVPGNHDTWVGMDKMRKIVAASGLEWLINDHRVIRRRGDRLIIAGIDDPWDGKPNLDQALAGSPNNVPTILLAHAPNVADAAINYPSIAIQFSGHTHGGQVHIPGVGPLVLPDQSWRYPSGLYNVPRAESQQPLWVYTNRGLGVAELPLRFACRPEVTIVTLKRDEKSRRGL